MIRARTRRGGFTLIELLVVIGIIALLAAIGVGTYFRMLASSEESGTATTLQKLTAPLMRQWSAARDTADQEWKNNTGGCQETLTQYCANDRDRAKALWMYLRLKNEFPQSFAEATKDTELYDSSNTLKLTIPKKKAFAVLPSPVTTTDISPAEQSAIILRMILERGSRGETYGDEATGGLGGEKTFTVAATSKSYTFPVFKDLYGSPLMYVRYGSNNEINGSPFTKGGGAGKDPLDPAGKLAYAATLPSPWNNNRAKAIEAVFGTSAGTNAAGAWPAGGVNWLVTIISAGPEKAYDTNVSAVQTNGLIDVVNFKDDILGYQFRREGLNGRGPQ